MCSAEDTFFLEGSWVGGFARAPGRCAGCVFFSAFQVVFSFLHPCLWAFSCDSVENMQDNISDVATCDVAVSLYDLFLSVFFYYPHDSDGPGICAGVSFVEASRLFLCCHYFHLWPVCVSLSVCLSGRVWVYLRNGDV